MSLFWFSATAFPAQVPHFFSNVWYRYNTHISTTLAHWGGRVQRERERDVFLNFMFLFRKLWTSSSWLTKTTAFAKCQSKNNQMNKTNYVLVGLSLSRLQPQLSAPTNAVSRLCAFLLHMLWGFSDSPWQCNNSRPTPLLASLRLIFPDVSLCSVSHSINSSQPRLRLQANPDVSVTGCYF